MKVFKNGNKVIAEAKSEKDFEKSKSKVLKEVVDKYGKDGKLFVSVDSEDDVKYLVYLIKDGFLSDIPTRLSQEQYDTWNDLRDIDKEKIKERIDQELDDKEQKLKHKYVENTNSSLVD